MIEIEGKEGVEIMNTEEVIRQQEESFELPEEDLDSSQSDEFNNSLQGYILNVFDINKTARRNSKIEYEMEESLRAYNGEYDPSDLAKIQADGGSEIYMNLTSTKCRALASWIKDIVMPSIGKAWEINPSIVPEIDPELEEKIEEALREEFINYERSQQEGQSGGEGPQQPQEVTPPASPAAAPSPASPQQQQKPAKPPGALSVATRLREMNKARRDIHETIRTEISLIAKSEMKDMEKMIEDQLHAGGWEKALGDFVDNFVVFPTAFMKGPVIQKERKCKYVGGEIKSKEEYVFRSYIVSPFDMYPSPSATDISDGNLIEHIRLERKDLLQMKRLGAEAGYSVSKIEEVLENNSQAFFVNWWNSDIEDDKAELEKRGTSSDANANILHGLHFFGAVPVKLLREWGYSPLELVMYEDTDEVEVEAILVENTVIKVLINEDLFYKRPYYKASFQNIPGSFWGRSLPNLMRDIQRMCNATARALSNNMGLSSGPQVEVVIERLADANDITEIHPFKIWQTTSDPTGSGGRAVQFEQISSNAAELLAVYKEFELRADDATGIPRYAYGNERTGGAAATASGLSMLLESASKGVKNAIRNIDKGVIIPRIESQFYWNIKTYGEELDYTGDIEVVAKASAALTVKAAEQSKRIEFLQAISGNPQILEVLGAEGMAEIFRSILQDVNLSEVVIPSRLELKEKEKQKQEAVAKQQEMMASIEKEKLSTGLKATEIQISGQERMHQGTLSLKQQELGLKQQDIQNKAVTSVEALDSKERIAASKNTIDAAKAMADQASAQARQQSARAIEERVNRRSV